MHLLKSNVRGALRKAGDGTADRRLPGWFGDKDGSTFFGLAITLMAHQMGVLRVARRGHRAVCSCGKLAPSRE